MATSSKPKSNIISGTGGAVPVKNEKGEISMQKVKVNRYVAGKRPNYAPDSDDERNSPEISDNSEDDEVRISHKANIPLKTDIQDRRLKRLEELEKDPSDVSHQHSRRRHVAEPVILKEDDKSEDDMDIESSEDEQTVNKVKEESDEEQIDEEERIRKRMELKKKALQRQVELMAREEEKAQMGGDGSESESEEESEYEDEEYSESEDEVAPRLKPVFVRKQDRVTIEEKEAELEKEKLVELEKERLHVESKKQIKKIIQDEIAREKLAEKETDDNIQCDFKTDDENDQNEYEAWKLRELKRIKRDREEKENMDKEKQEIQKIRNMTEEEREKYFKLNPKLITNRRTKGSYKFMQKYYHRGAFYMDQEEDVFRQNFAEPTLEDKFDKSVLPKVMQVKNFGMAGRTKYTHLADQDTTKLDEENPWANQEKFIVGKGGGTKQVFDKPTAKKRK